MNREQLKYIKENNSLEFPKIVQLEITNECAFNCPQCYKQNIGNVHADFIDIKRMIDYCYSKGTKLFVLNGGEPLLYKHFKELILFINKYDVEINIFTSGYHLDLEWVQFWKEHSTEKYNLFLSLNGSTHEINSLSRQGYDITMEAIKLLCDNNIPYYINWVARHNNVHDLPNMIDLAEKFNSLGIEIICEKLTGKKQIMSPLTKNDIMYLADLINNNNSKVKLLVEKCFPLLLNFLRNIKSSMFDGCFAGKMLCMYTLEKTFAPCTQLYFPEKFDTLEEYWNKSKIIKNLRVKEKPDICNVCKFDKCNFCKAMSLESIANLKKGFKECPIHERA